MLLRQDTSINKIYILSKSKIIIKNFTIFENNYLIMDNLQITALKPLTVLMSLVPLEVIDNGDTLTFLFQQTVPVHCTVIFNSPSYWHSSQ